jgi:hypothetical protein
LAGRQPLGPFLFGGYDTNNKLPYSENWTFDIQYQASNSWLFDVGYVGNHGFHEILPIPFNQPLIATPQNPVNGQIYSYGGLSPLSSCNSGGLDLEPLCPPPYYAGNAEVRVPYIGYDMNSVLYKAEGISNYHALGSQAFVERAAAYRLLHLVARFGRAEWPRPVFHREQSPEPQANYASADFDQTHVFLINYSYTLPNLTADRRLGELIKRLDPRRADGCTKRTALQRLRLLWVGGGPLLWHLR